MDEKYIPTKQDYDDVQSHNERMSLVTDKVIAEVLYDLEQQDKEKAEHHIKILERLSNEIPLNPMFRATIADLLVKLKVEFKEKFPG